MHILFVAVSFPSPEFPHRSPFLREQVRLLCEEKRIDRVTVLSPTTYVPVFLSRLRRAAAQAKLPRQYTINEDRCVVYFPRYLKLPGDLLLSWTVAQWRRIVERAIARFARTQPISVIHANSGTESAWASICAGRRHHIPCAVTYQGSEVHRILEPRRKGWELCRDSFRFADLNLPVSRSLDRTLRSYAQPLGRCETMLRGVDRSRFFPHSEPTTAPNALFVGRIEEPKGVFDLLLSWRKVHRASPDAKLTIVGPDCTDGLVFRHARKLGIDGSIVFTGPLPLDEVADRMRQSRLLCLPSHAEGTPNCIMEALSCGLPVVATRVGGIPELLVHDQTGLLTAKGDIDALAHAMLSLFTDQNRWLRIRRTASQFASQNLDARQTVSRLVQLYAELLAGADRTQISSPSTRPA